MNRCMERSPPLACHVDRSLDAFGTRHIGFRKECSLAKPCGDGFGALPINVGHQNPCAGRRQISRCPSAKSRGGTGNENDSISKFHHFLRCRRVKLDPLRLH
jgi:hypothetical protein